MLGVTCDWCAFCLDEAMVLRWEVIPENRAAEKALHGEGRERRLRRLEAVK